MLYFRCINSETGLSLEMSGGTEAEWDIAASLHLASRLEGQTKT